MVGAKDLNHRQGNETSGKGLLAPPFSAHSVPAGRWPGCLGPPSGAAPDTPRTYKAQQWAKAWWGGPQKLAGGGHAPSEIPPGWG